MDTAVLAVVRAARPAFRSRQDKLAFAVHAFLLAQGFKLVAAGAAAEDEAQDWEVEREEVGAEGWDALDGAYAFRYQDTEGKRAPLYVKLLGLGDALLVHWAAGGAEPGPALELSAQRFTTDAPAVADSYQHLGELVAKLEASMAGALARGGARGGAAAASSKQQQQSGAGAGARGRRGAGEDGGEEDEPGISPLQEGPARMGGVGLLAPRYPGGVGVGYEDVVPPGGRPPGYGPGLGGGLGGLVEGPPGLGGGGMHVGPGHPMFGPGRLGDGVGRGGPPAPGEGLPPGARWDPITPPGLPGFRPGDFQHPDPSRPHPDLMQPGPGRSDFDAYFG
eukprot:scaffold3.g6670.t1